MLEVGAKAPDFRLPSTRGGDVSLKDFRGQKVVIYFYPKDDTPGCTQEACDFRDSHGALKRVGVVVLGVSKDSLTAHEKFRGKYELPFELLSDADNAVATAYGAYGEKVMYGRKTMGTIRSTFLIDEKGAVQAMWPKVKVQGHVDKVLEALGLGEKKPAKTPKAAAPAKKAKAAPKGV